MKTFSKSLMMLAIVALFSCGEDAPPNVPTPRDAGADASSDATSDGSGDDAAAVDAAIDAADGATIEASVDAATTDASSDAMLIGDAAELSDLCLGFPVADECGEGCAPGTACVRAACGGTRCVQGRDCLTMSDCGGLECVLDEETGTGTCTPNADGACSTSAQCSLGFECESSRCVDRRIVCSGRNAICPVGYLCQTPTPGEHAVCMPGMLRCDDTSGCSGMCADANGDGLRECLPMTGACNASRPCVGGAGVSCGIASGIERTQCGLEGLCTEGSCADGYVCTNPTNGVAAPQCRLRGTCTENRECPEGQICGAYRGEALACIGGRS